MRLEMKYIIAALVMAGLVSAADAETSLTVYNQNLALVREVRKMDFKSGTGELRFRDVAAQIDATSVHFAASGVEMLEQNFDYDLVSPDKLLQKYIDRDIEVVTKDGVTKGTLLTSSWGTQGSQVVLQQSDGSVRSILQDNIMEIRYPELPGGLITKPTLRWLVNAKDGGSKDAEVSYLTGGLSWRADYVLVMNTANTRTDVDAWVTIDNTSGASYHDAKVKLIAGEVHRAPTPRQPVPMYAATMRMEGKAAPQFEEQAFFEYHLYTLQRPATVADNQTKQISLFPSTSANLRKIYEFDYQKKSDRVGVSVEFENREENGLGMALPAGRVRVYQKGPDGSQEFLGEDNVEHTPKNENVRVQIGNAFDIIAERTQTDFRQISGLTTETDIQVKLRNHKKEAVDIVVVDYFWGDWEITKKSADFVKVSSRKVEFTMHVEPEQETTLTYTVRVKS
jgi:hypothetical protein